MSFLRWAPSFLGFPLGGWLAFQLAGSVTGTLTAAAAGAIAGALIGTAQWLSLERAVGWPWIVASIIGMGAGSALAAVATGASTTTSALVTSGFITGAVVGAAQGLMFRRGPRITALWAATVSISWALGWLVTANVIVDAERAYVIFGASGALVVAAVTGLVLRRILGPAKGRRLPHTASAAAPAAVKPAR